MGFFCLRPILSFQNILYKIIGRILLHEDKYIWFILSESLKDDGDKDVDKDKKRTNF